MEFKALFGTHVKFIVCSVQNIKYILFSLIYFICLTMFTLAYLTYINIMICSNIITL